MPKYSNHPHPPCISTSYPCRIQRLNPLVQVTKHDHTIIALCLLSTAVVMMTCCCDRCQSVTRSCLRCSTLFFSLSSPARLSTLQGGRRLPQCLFNGPRLQLRQDNSNPAQQVFIIIIVVVVIIIIIVVIGCAEAKAFFSVPCVRLG